VARKDGPERPVPNICLKVPTGGGKTLLGTLAVERINTEYCKKQTGFGCTFRGTKDLEDRSGADVQVGLNAA